MEPAGLIVTLTLKASSWPTRKPRPTTAEILGSDD